MLSSHKFFTNRTTKRKLMNVNGKERSQVINNSDNEDYDETSNDPAAIAAYLSLERTKIFRDHNHIFFRTSVTNNSINRLCNLIDEYNREQEFISADHTSSIVIPKPIYLHITCMGGDLLAGFMAHDYIKNSKIPIYTIAEGYAVSSGANMFMAGKKRFMTQHSYILIHQLNQTNGFETFHDMIDNTANVIEFMSKLYEMYLNNVRYDHKNISHDDILTKEKLENHMLHDIYWNYDTCKRYGLVDDLYTNYSNCDKIDLNEIFTSCEKKINKNKILTQKDLKPSDAVIHRIKKNVESQNSLVNIINNHLNKKKTTNKKNALNNHDSIIDNLVDELVKDQQQEEDHYDNYDNNNDDVDVDVDVKETDGGLGTRTRSKKKKSPKIYKPIKKSKI